jgi:tetratricopeptide (TPR) repeat protein
VDIFVSYKSDDRDRVRPIVEALENAGWSVWWDTRIEAGRAFDREIEREIDSAKCVIAVWSETSIDSDWVRNEASEGLDRGVLVPVAIDEVRPPLAFRRQQTLYLGSDIDYDKIITAVARLVPLKATTAKEVLPCVGRDRETSDMRRVLEAVKDGTGGTVFVGGEPGIGKTRLIREVRADALRQGFNVLTGNCRKELALPYEPWIEQFEQTLRNIPADQIPQMFSQHASEVSFLLPKLTELVPNIPERVELPPEQERRFLMNGLTAFLQDQAENNSPLVLIFEDLQWADESTCLLIQHLAARVENSKLLILGTFRDAEMETSSPASTMFQTLLRERLAEDLILRRLRRHEVVQMLNQLAGKEAPEELVDLIFEETEGNPFFVEEVYRHLLELGKLFDDDGDFLPGIHIADTEVPRGVLLVIQNRLERMSDTCQSTLTLAAVTGRNFPFRLLASSSDLDEDTLLEAIEEATAAALIEDLSTDREASYRFVHEQIRQTLLHDLSFPRRQRMHIKIATAMQKSRGRTIEIAHHLYAAGDAADHDETLNYLEKAIDEGLEALAFEDVLVVMDQAEELVDDDAARARLVSRRARALRGSNNIEGAASVLTDGIDTITNPDLAHTLLMEKIALLVDAYRADATIGDLNKILEKARATSNETLELEALLFLSRATYQQSLDQPGKAQEWFDTNTKAIDKARKLGDQKALALALMSTSHALDYWPDRKAIAHANVREAHQIAQASGDEGLELEAQRLGLQIHILPAGETELESENIRNRILARRDPLQLKEFLFWMMWQMYHLGKAKRAVEVSTEDIELSEELGLPPVQYPTIRGLAHIDLGQFQDAHTSISGEVTSGEYRFGRAFQNYGFALFYYHLNDFDKAFQIILDLIPELVALKRNWMIEALANQIGRDIFSMPQNIQSRARDLFDALVLAITNQGGEKVISFEVQVLMGDDFDEAISQLQATTQKLEKSPNRRQWIEMEAVLQRLYLKQKRWSDLVEPKETVFQFVEHSELNRQQWKLFALRARGNLETGQIDKAKADAQRARDCFEDILETIPSQDLQETFKAHPMALDLASVLKATN